ncbi:hypothetical protein FB451DRAFT_1312383, partial [Mycena latifolia]
MHGCALGFLNSNVSRSSVCQPSRVFIIVAVFSSPASSAVMHLHLCISHAFSCQSCRSRTCRATLNVFLLACSTFFEGRIVVGVYKSGYDSFSPYYAFPLLV